LETVFKPYGIFSYQLKAPLKNRIIKKFLGNEIKEFDIRGEKILNIISNVYLSRAAKDLETMEPDTLNWIDRFESESVFYDVGASTGPFSLYAAVKKQSQVIAFEPEAQNFSVLEKHHYLNREKLSKPIKSLNLALSNNVGLGNLFIFNYQPGAAMKILDKPIKRLEKNEFTPSHVQTVIKDRLDDIIKRYNLPFPNYIKIDVDGSELDVVEGAIHTLSDPHIRSVLIEIEDTDEKNLPIIKKMEDYGFQIEEKNQLENYEGLFNYIFTK